MKRVLTGLLLLVLALAVAGCSSEKDRGANKDLDKPKAQKDAEQ